MALGGQGRTLQDGQEIPQAECSGIQAAPVLFHRVLHRDHIMGPSTVLCRIHVLGLPEMSIVPQVVVGPTVLVCIQHSFPAPQWTLCIMSRWIFGAVVLQTHAELVTWVLLNGTPILSYGALESFCLQRCPGAGLVDSTREGGCPWLALLVSGAVLFNFCCALQCLVVLVKTIPEPGLQMKWLPQIS